MAYIGNSPANVGNYQIVDTIASSFNASVTSFALASGGITITPAKSGQLLVGINGVMQQPDDTGTNGFKVSGSNIVFSSAPASGDTFWAVYQGQNVDIGTPSDDVVDTAHIKDNAITAAKIAAGAVVADVANDSITNAMMADDAIDSAQIASGAVDDAHIVGLTASKLSGALPAISAASLTAIPAANITGTLPAIDGSSLTGITGSSDYRPSGKPIIINGDMSVSQRGTANADESSSGIYRVDRMNVGLSSIGEFRMSQESISSGAAFNAGFKKAFRIDCAIADASPASGDIGNVTYKLEGNTVQAFKKGTSNAETATLAFWVKSNKTGTAQVSLIDGDNSRQVGATYTISSADTWEHKVLNYPADTTGALDNDNNKSLEIEFALDAGSDFTSGAVPSAWEAAANTDRSVNDLALQDNTANDWAITGLQLEVGTYTSATLPPFQFEGYGDNLARCQRYFCKSGSPTVAYASDLNQFYSIMSMHGTSNGYMPRVLFPVTMRGNPTTVTGAISSYNGSAWQTWTGSNSTSKFPDGFTLGAAGTLSVTVGESRLSQTDWTADAEL